MNRRVLAILALLCGLAAFSSADEGMWLFNKAPKDQLKTLSVWFPSQICFVPVEDVSYRAEGQVFYFKARNDTVLFEV